MVKPLLFSKPDSNYEQGENPSDGISKSLSHTKVQMPWQFFLEHGGEGGLPLSQVGNFYKIKLKSVDNITWIVIASWILAQGGSLQLY